jgi:hypothetical protein
MQTKTHVSRILWFEATGFLLIITLSWVNELSDLPRLAGSDQYIPNWRESVFESLIVILASIPVMILSKGLLSRLHHLEGFLRVCAWCKKLEQNGYWLPLEEFLENKFQTGTSHGICPKCAENERRKIAASRAS